MKKVIFVAVSSMTMLFSGGGPGDSIEIIQNLPIETERRETVSASPYYVGLGFARGHYDGCIYSGCQYEDVTFGITGRAGYEWNQYVGVEVRVLSTFWGADPLGGQKLQYGGVFAKPMYGLGENFNIYGLIGYGWTKTRTGGNGNLQTVDESGFSGGLGLEYDFSSKEEDRENKVAYNRIFDGQANQENGWGAFIDYQRLLIKSGEPVIDAITIGLTYDF